MNQIASLHLADATAVRPHPRILMASSDAVLSKSLRALLERLGYETELVAGPGPVCDHVLRSPADAVILDGGTDKAAALTLCRRLRDRPETRRLPVLMLAPQAHETYAIRALNEGADECLIGPVSPGLFTARLHALLRRVPPATRPPLACGDVVIDPVQRRVRRRERSTHVGPTDYRLLEMLLRHPGRLFSREDLVRAVWGSNTVDRRTVDAHIRSLRRALNGPGEPDLITTVREVGYMLRPRTLAETARLPISA